MFSVVVAAVVMVVFVSFCCSYMHVCVCVSVCVCLFCFYEADLKHVTLHAVKGKKAGNFGSLFCGVFFICERTTALTRSPKIGMY